MNLVDPIRDKEKIEDIKLYLNENKKSFRTVSLIEDKINDFYGGLNL